MLSPDGRYVIAEFAAQSSTAADFPMAVFRTSDGAEVADLGSRFTFQGDPGAWSTFAFLPDGRRLEGDRFFQGKDSIRQVDLETGTVSPELLVSRWPAWSSLVGVSGDCALVIDSSLTLSRSCGGCQPFPLASNTSSGLVSLDGGRYLSQDDNAQVAPTVLRDISSHPGVLQTYPPRPEEAGWLAREAPVAISAHGDRVITSAYEDQPCSWAPGFTSRVHDVATDTIIDDLPPAVTSTSADLAVIAYGPVLWCAR
jgi:hypothetical protein